MCVESAQTVVVTDTSTGNAVLNTGITVSGTILSIGPTSNLSKGTYTVVVNFALKLKDDTTTTKMGQQTVTVTIVACEKSYYSLSAAEVTSFED